MRSSTVTLRFPQPLWENREKLRKATGAKSVNAMLVGMLRYAYLHGGEHSVSNALADLPLPVQDEIDDKIIEKFLEGTSLHGSYLKHLVDEAVDTLANGQQPPVKKIVDDILDQIAGKEAERPKNARGKKKPAKA